MTATTLPAESGHVLVPSNGGRGSTRRYHTTACFFVEKWGDGMTEWDRETAEAWGIAQCQNCQEAEEAE